MMSDSTDVSELAKTLRDDLAKDWPDPGSNCPSEAELQAYRPTTDPSAPGYFTGQHIFACKPCYRKFLERRSESTLATMKLDLADADYNDWKDNPEKAVEIALNSDRPSWVRCAAIEQVGESRDPHFASKLSTLAGDEEKDEDVRDTAKDALLSLGRKQEPET